MAKLKPNVRIQKHRTEEEMRRALSDLYKGKAQKSNPQQDDDSDVIINDVIEELLEKRAAEQEVRGFVQSMAAKFSIKLR